jgi:predicted Zn-dependent protease
MKTLIVTLILTASVLAQADETSTNLPSPAQRRIDAAKLVLQKQPSRYQAYNDLALGLARRARETGDARYYQQAEQAIESSLRIQPQNFEGRQAHVSVLFGERRYRQALEEAQALNRAMPDALLVWGYIAEADAALGDYDQAGKAAQWMMNLRPGNLPAYLCGASLREDWGDTAGAIEFLSKALQGTPPLETEETAWILTAMARLNRLSGGFDSADDLLQQAQKIVPDYYLTLEEWARLRMAQNRYEDAVGLIERRNRNFPSLQGRYLLAEALEHAGHGGEASVAYARFESDARSRINEADNDNRELILYYAGRGHRADEALRVAQLEFRQRHDVWTLDAYAWALYSNRQYEEARRQFDAVLAVGTRDATLFYHAASIAKATGDEAAAGRYLRMSLEIDPASAASESE